MGRDGRRAKGRPRSACSISRRIGSTRAASALPGMPSPLEFWALEAALDGLEAEGLTSRIARHARAAQASRAGLEALGATPWVDDPRRASALVTATPVPEGLTADAVIERAARYGVTLSPGYGAIRDRMVRLAHTGEGASFADCRCEHRRLCIGAARPGSAGRSWRRRAGGGGRLR